MSSTPLEQFDALPTSEELAETLLVSFRWAETPEGHEYWEKRYWHLVSARAPVSFASAATLDLSGTKLLSAQPQASC